MMSSVGSVVSRLWAPVVLSVASTVAVGFAINFLTARPTLDGSGRHYSTGRQASGGGPTAFK
jgi:hypothetical protein